MTRFPRKPVAGSSSSVGGDTPIPFAEEAVTPIDLPSVLKLGGVSSPQVLLAQQRVMAVTAQQQLAAAQALPDFNLGANYDKHTGVLQQPSGNILNVLKNNLYVGAGAYAVGSGTVNIPGLQYNLNAGDAYFTYLASRQLSERSRAAAQATQNNTLLTLAVAYCQLVRAQGAQAIAVKMRDDAAEVARITASYAKIGQARPADAERAATELEMRKAELLAREVDIAQASARLVEVLNLESSVRLRSSETWMVPRSIVPEPIKLPELIAIALYRRPEVAEYRAGVHAAMLQLSNARLLPFSPQVMAGFSDGAFGGGSNISTAATGASPFGNFNDRSDADIALYWSIRNLGLGNQALIKVATSRLAVANLDQTRQLNTIRAEVAGAYARMQSCAARLDIKQRSVVSSERGYQADVRRAKAGEGLPIEVLNSLRLLSVSQLAYLDTIFEYNQAHYELYVAIGQPPADLLIRTTATPTPADQTEESK